MKFVSHFSRKFSPEKKLLLVKILLVWSFPLLRACHFLTFICSNNAR